MYYIFLSIHFKIEGRVRISFERWKETLNYYLKSFGMRKLVKSIEFRTFQTCKTGFFPKNVNGFHLLPLIPKPQSYILDNVFNMLLHLKRFLKLFLLQSWEAVVQRCSVKKVFLEISQNSQENTCARVFFYLIKLQA